MFLVANWRPARRYGIVGNGRTPMSWSVFLVRRSPTRAKKIEIRPAAAPIATMAGDTAGQTNYRYSGPYKSNAKDQQKVAHEIFLISETWR